MAGGGVLSGAPLSLSERMRVARAQRRFGRSWGDALWPSEAERAAVVWRRVHGPPPPPAEPAVLFAVPLIGRAHAADWAGVEANLRRTIASVTAQNDGHWRLVICGQDRPAACDGDPRIAFAPFPETPPGVSDKGAKLRCIVETLRREGTFDGYFFALDADDFVHPRLVRHIVSGNNGRGYIIVHGYQIDALSGDLARLAPPGPFGFAAGRDQRTPVYKRSGSCAALRLDAMPGRAHVVDMTLRLLSRSHTRFAPLAAMHGVPLEPVPFPAMFYVVNHGQNRSQLRSLRLRHRDKPMQYHAVHRIPADRQDAIRAAFGWPGPAPAYTNVH